MKSRSLIINCSVAAVFALLTLIPVAALAQLPGSSAAMMNAALVKLFGNNSAFSARAEIRVLDKTGKETDTVPLNFTLQDGKMRMDIDISQVKSTELPPATIPTLKEMGMDQATIIMRPDKKLTLNIFPRVKCYSETPMSKEEIAASEKTFKLEKTRLGKESMEGHSCEKHKVILIDDKGEKHEATLWNATDLKDFPVQIQMTEGDTTVMMKFKDIKLGKMDPTRFEAPAGLTKYKSPEALSEAAAKGSLPAPTPK